MSDLSNESIHTVVECVLRAGGFDPHAAVSQADGHSDPLPISALDLKPFNLAAALDGAAFIHRFDIHRMFPERFICREIHPFEHPENPAYLVWSKEWLVYPINDEGMADIQRDFYMVVDPNTKAVR